MNEETIRNLLGVVLIIALIGVTMFTIRQTYNNFVQAMKLRQLLRQQRLDRITEKFRKEQVRIGKEVEPKFELWWSVYGKKLVEESTTFGERIRLPFDITELPEQIQNLVKGSAVQKISESALEYAIHLANSDGQSAYLQSVRRLDKVLARDLDEQYSQHLEDHRTELLDNGFDLDKFEGEFRAR